MALTSFIAVPGRSSVLHSRIATCFKLWRNDKPAGAGQNAQAAFVDELRADVGHVGKQRGFVERLRHRRGIGPRAAVERMRGREQRLPVADLRGVVDVAEVQDVGALDFLELGKRFLKLQVGRVELRLVQIVIDGLAGDRVAQRHLDMHKRPCEALARVVVELSRSAFVLEERQADERHLRRAFDRHVRLVGFEYFVPLSRNHLVGAANVEQSRQEFGANICKCYGHLSFPPYATPVSARNLSLLNVTTTQLKAEVESDPLPTPPKLLFCGLPNSATT